MPRTPAIDPDQFATFGELLKYLRRRAGLTQRELSIGVGYSESQISRLEQNQRPPDQAALAARFVPALHVEKEPEWAARLLDLAMASRAEADPDEAEPLVETASTPHGNTRFPHGYNLPPQLTSFIGREKEIAEVKLLLSQIRLVTLTGAGGAGKTRLSLQVAAGLLDASAFPDGAWLIELAPLADPALVPQLVAAALGLREILDQPVVDLLRDHLRPKHLLLVLDNCELLVQACAELAETLLRGCPQLNILATSRESLGITGESAYHLRSLSFPGPNQPDSPNTLEQSEAARLFIDRAAAALPGFTLTAENAAAVAQICRQLDGIPLAIELAAARVKILRAEQIAARLAEHERFRLLTSGSRTASRRHQTLSALIDWSHDLLPPAEKVLFQRLSVFAGGWILEAAEAVCSDNVLDLLAQLANKSLVMAERQPGAEVRYGMLETIRHYALAKLEASGALDSVRQAHAVYFLSLAESAKIDTVATIPELAVLTQKLARKRPGIFGNFAFPGTLATVSKNWPLRLEARLA